MHNIVEMTNQGRKDVIFWFKSDNQRFMSRKIIVFVIGIDANIPKIIYESLKDLHFQFFMLNSPGLASL